MSYATTTAEADARLVSKSKDVNVPGFSLKRMWSFIDATVADTLSVALDAVETYSDPKADNQSYTGTFVNSRVEGIEGSSENDDNNERYVNIVQTLIKVTTITAVGDLPSPRATQENEILQALGFETGEEDTMAYIYENLDPRDATRKACMDISDASLQGLANVATVSPATGWIYVDRKFEEKADKTGTFVVLFKQVAWNEWGHDTYAYDIIEHGDAGSDTGADNAGESPTVTKTWLNIQKDDMATAESECREAATVAPETGYIITDVIISDNRNGSIDVKRVEKKQVNDKDESGSVQLNPHGIFPGTTTSVRTIYRNFQSGSLPAGDSVTAGGNVISNIPSIQGDGLWSREVVTRVPAWGKSWSDKVKMRETDTGGYQLQEVYEAGGISEANRDTAFTAAQSADSDRNVKMVQLIERANGERIIHQMQGRTYDGTTDNDALIIKLGDQVGNKEATLGRVWWRRTAAAKNTLTTSSGAAISDYTYDGTAFTHLQAQIDDNGDGTYNVFQVLIVPIWTYSTFGTRHDTTDEVEWKYDQIWTYNSSNNIVKKDRVIWRKTFATYADAKAYVDDGTGGTPGASTDTYSSQRGDAARHLGWVDFIGDDSSGSGVWAGYNVQLS